MCACVYEGCGTEIFAGGGDLSNGQSDELFMSNSLVEFCSGKCLWYGRDSDIYGTHT